MLVPQRRPVAREDVCHRLRHVVGDCVVCGYAHFVGSLGGRKALANRGALRSVGALPIALHLAYALDYFVQNRLIQSASRRPLLKDCEHLIDVAFAITTDGNVHVTATDIETGQAQELRIEGAIGLDDNQLAEIMAQAS